MQKWHAQKSHPLFTDSALRTRHRYIFGFRKLCSSVLRSVPSYSVPQASPPEMAGALSGNGVRLITRINAELWQVTRTQLTRPLRSCMILKASAFEQFGLWSFLSMLPTAA